MRVLQVHNKYLRGGGEDTVADLEAGMLRDRGNDVERLLVSNEELNGASAARLAWTAASLTWSAYGYSVLRQRIAQFRPDIVHVHNTFPLLSASVFWAARRLVPVVHTLHNFRITCANALLLREGRP